MESQCCAGLYVNVDLFTDSRSCDIGGYGIGRKLACHYSDISSRYCNLLFSRLIQIYLVNDTMFSGICFPDGKVSSTNGVPFDYLCFKRSSNCDFPIFIAGIIFILYILLYFFYWKNIQRIYEPEKNWMRSMVFWIGTVKEWRCFLYRGHFHFFDVYWFRWANKRVR